MSQASLFFIQEINSKMEDANISGDVSLYLSTPERMVRDSINIHLALMSAWCVCVCVCVCMYHLVT